MYFDITGVIVTVVTGLILAVIGNLMTTPVQRWWAERSQKSAWRYVEGKMKFLVVVEHFRNAPNEYQTYLLKNIAEMIVHILRIVVLVGLLIAYIWGISIFNTTVTRPYEVYQTLIQFALIMGSLPALFAIMEAVFSAILLWELQRNTLRLIKGIQRYQATKETVTKDIARIKQKYPNLRWDTLQSQIESEYNSLVKI